MLIPNPDPIGLPAPVWILQGLLVFTFILHVVPMSITLGGSFLALVALIRGRRSADGALHVFAGQLARMLPWITAFTITMGVAPLLFVQVLYGLFFYPSTILMGWPWLSVVGFLLVGYGGLYLSAWNGEALGAWRPWVMAASTALFLGVAFVYSNAYSLLTAPDRWPAMFAAYPGTGTALNLADPSLWPRLTHILLGVLGLAAAVVAWLGHLAPDPAYGRQVRRFGLGWLVPALLLQTVVAPWYLARMSTAGQAALDGFGLTALIPLAAALVVLALALFAAAEKRRRSPGLAAAGLTALVLATAVLAVLRQMVRQAELAPYLPATAWQVQPQMGVFVIFLVLLVAAVALLGWLVVRFLRAGDSGQVTRAA